MLTRWGVAIGLMALIGAAAWTALPEQRPSLGRGATAPVFELPDLAGERHALPRGRVILLNFWATWCPPCREEMPSMAVLSRRLADRGLEVVAVSVDRDVDALSGFVREHDIPFRVLHDAESRVSHAYGVYKYPETFLIGRDGRIRHHLIGSVDWTASSVVEVVESLLAEEAAPVAAGA